MKTFNYLRTKSLVKKFAKVGMIALVLASCGKDNTVNTNNNSGIRGQSPIYTNPAISQAFNQLKSRYRCNSAQPRTEVALTVAAPNGPFGNRIYGNLAQGQTQGSTQGTYLGADRFTNDLISVTKVTNGSSSAYNIVMSMCSYQSQTGQPIIGSGAQLSNFKILDPIVVAESSNPYGNVLFGSIGFSSSVSPGKMMFDSFTVAQ